MPAVIDITFCRSSEKLPTLERPLTDGMGACRLLPSTVLPVSVGREYVLGAAGRINNYVVDRRLNCWSCIHTIAALC